MGDGWEGGDKDGRNGENMGYNVQGSHIIGVVIWERELDGDGGHDKITIGISSLASKKDYGDARAAYNEWRVGVPPGG